jgi:hypothetical protein
MNTAAAQSITSSPRLSDAGNIKGERQRRSMCSSTRCAGQSNYPGDSVARQATQPDLTT